MLGHPLPLAGEGGFGRSPETGEGYPSTDNAYCATFLVSVGKA